jgi:glutathione S-transferase
LANARRTRPYTLIKERKFGAGCLDAWLGEREALFERGRHLLAPSLSTLSKTPFLFGSAPTLADAALYGLCAMLEEGDAKHLGQLSPALVDFARRLEAKTKSP